MKTVSILVPMYCVERYIEQCARSLFSQSYPHCEFIFVDDASVDNTLQRLTSVAGDYPALSSQIKIVELEQNGGVAAARNAALEAASGDYILFVDADDWVSESIIEELVNKAEQRGAQICNAWCQTVASDDRRKPTPTEWLQPKSAHLKAILGQSHIVPNHVRGMLFARALFLEHGLRFTPRVDFGEDYSLLPQLIYHASVLATLPSYLYFYRVENDGSYMNNIGQKQIGNYIAASKIVENFVLSLPDAALYKGELERGRVNIKKWIFKRGVEVAPYEKLLFGEESPRLASPLLRLYNRAIDSGSGFLVKVMSVVVNLPLYVREKFKRFAR